MAYLIVDEMHHQSPDLLKDQYWEVVVPEQLPHTHASEQYKELSHVSSTANLNLMCPSSLRSDHYMEDGILTKTSGSKRSIFRLGRSGSNRSSTSIPSQITTVGSVANRLNRIGSAFKRTVTKEKSPVAVQSDGENLDTLITQSGMASSHDVIPELDENTITIVSMGKPAKDRPTAKEIFSTEEIPMFMMDCDQSLLLSSAPDPVMTLQNDDNSASP